MNLIFLTVSESFMQLRLNMIKLSGFTGLFYLGINLVKSC